MQTLAIPSSTPFLDYFNTSLPLAPFLDLAFSLLLEQRTHLFLLKTPAETSSLMFLLRGFLQPFPWCYPFVPMLPLNMRDIVDAPVPLMLGMMNSTEARMDFVSVRMTDSNFVIEGLPQGTRELFREVREAVSQKSSEG